jgi:PhoPQ-activated pathogenicity-related protein
LRPGANFYLSIATQAPRPRFTWSFEDDGSTRVETQTPPSAVNLWQATNPNARDFRLQSIGRAYTSSALADLGGRVYVARVPEPERGWTAFLVEMTFPEPGDTPYKFTSGVRVTPDRLPFDLPPEER